MKPDGQIVLRPEVRRFAELMELKLRENDHKGGWGDDTCGALFARMIEEGDELHEALAQIRPIPEKVASEAADVANFCLMIADNAGGLR
jgi:NTP pyrophosphatase (non-canonical NTP hydrolase)